MVSLQSLAKKARRLGLGGWRQFRRGVLPAGALPQAASKALEASVAATTAADGRCGDAAASWSDASSSAIKAAWAMRNTPP
ncbi:hypothetical protein THIX_20393 [Thiomonas sp. X19]|nr:hypothetical protein THIX_20393 [Thiomonas sp. X19]